MSIIDLPLHESMTDGRAPKYFMHCRRGLKYVQSKLRVMESTSTSKDNNVRLPLYLSSERNSKPQHDGMGPAETSGKARSAVCTSCNVQNKAAIVKSETS